MIPLTLLDQVCSGSGSRSTLVTHGTRTGVERRRVGLCISPGLKSSGWGQPLVTMRLFWVISSLCTGQVPEPESLGTRGHAPAGVFWKDHFL